MQTYRVPKESDVVSSEKGGEVSAEAGVLPKGHPPLSEELPPGHPDVGGLSSDGGAASATVPSGSAPARLRWVVPKGWEEKPGSGFRYATFVVPGEEGRTGDFSVTVLEGQAGGLLSNINRWRGQIGLADLAESDLPAASRAIRPGGRPMTLVNFVSEENLIEGKHKKRLLAAICLSGGKCWFFKLVGEDRLVQAAEPDMLKFLESLRGV